MNFGLIEDIKSVRNVDLALRTKDGPEKFLNLMFEDDVLCQILWSCCEKQAQSQSVSQRDFYEALEGDSIAAGWEALRDAILFFIQSRSPSRADALRAALAAAMEVMDKQNQVVIATINSHETQQLMQSAVRKIEKQAQSAMNSALESSSTP